MNWIVIIISVLVAAFGVYKEVTRANRARLTLRIAATIVATVALACLILPVSYKSDNQTGTNNVVLLTTGTFNGDFVFSNTQRVYTLENGIKKKYPMVKLISNPSEILADGDAGQALQIYGYGLNEGDLKQLGNIPMEFNPPTIPDGITAANWTQIINTGIPFQVQGTIKNTGKPYKLLLRGLNTVLDSANVTTGIAVSFSMATNPKHSGRAVYNLIVIREKDTLFNEQIPVIIQPAQPLKVLMLSAAPDFENKFLRTWLGDNNYAVASRAIITKGKIGQDYFNMERIDLSHITSALLSKFDLIEADLSAIKTLTSAENSVLQQEVMNKGLGLIVRADTVDDKNPSWFQSNFKVLKSAKQPAAELIIQGKKTAKLTIDPNYIAQENDIQPVITDVHGNLISAATLSGSGKLIISTVNNTYSWMLAGNHDDYTAYWSALIDNVARKAKPANSWSVITPFPVPGQPVDLMYHSASAVVPAQINQSIVSPSQNPGIPFGWAFTYWPSQAGWRQATATGSVPYWWFVWPKGSWYALHATENARITAGYASKSTKHSSISGPKPQKVAVEISKFYFYVLLLVAAAFLWAEGKYSKLIN